MSDPNLKIEPNEHVIVKLRKHWIILLRDTAGTLVLGLLPFVIVPLILSTVPSMYLDTIGYYSLASFGTALWFHIVWMSLFVLWTDYYLDLWIVTDTRIISVDQINLFNRKVTTLSLDRIQEIIVKEENIVQAFFKYGTLDIETASPTDGDATMEGIPNPENVRSAILKQLGKETPLVKPLII